MPNNPNTADIAGTSEIRDTIASEISNDVEVLVDTLKRVLAIDEFGTAAGQTIESANRVHDELRFGIVRLFVEHPDQIQSILNSVRSMPSGDAH